MVLVRQTYSRLVCHFGIDMRQKGPWLPTGEKQSSGLLVLEAVGFVRALVGLSDRGGDDAKIEDGSPMQAPTSPVNSGHLKVPSFPVPS